MSPARLCIGSLVQLLVAACPVVGQTPPTQATQAPAPPPGAMNVVELTTITQGWAYLAQGDIDKADAIATEALRHDPSNPALVALAVETSIARAGWTAGLETYERWQSHRLVDDFYVLRRVARAALFEAAQSSDDAGLRTEAVQALWEGGEASAAAALLRQREGLGHPIDTQTLAALGDSEAVETVIAALQSDTGDRMGAIRALGRSRSPLAVAPLVEVLDHHPRPELRAAAAEALGRLDARAAIPALQALLNAEVPMTRMAAASALYQMRDFSGIAVLQLALGSEVPAVRLEAARAMAPRPGEMPDPSWLSVVRELARDPDAGIRIGAAQLLVAQDPIAARESVERLANAADLAVRDAAERALPAVMGSNFGEIRMLMKTADPLTRVRAAGRILALTR